MELKRAGQGFGGDGNETLLSRRGRTRESERVDLPKVQLSVRALSWSLFFLFPFPFSLFFFFCSGAADLHRRTKAPRSGLSATDKKRRLSAHTYAHARDRIEISDNVLIGLGDRSRANAVVLWMGCPLPWVATYGFFSDTTKVSTRGFPGVSGCSRFAVSQKRTSSARRVV